MSHVECLGVYCGETVEFDLSLAAAMYEVYNSKGELVPVTPAEAAPRGSLQFSLRIPSVFKNICGAFFDIRTSSWGAVEGVKVWVMLCGESLFIFDSPYEAELLRKLDLELIESIEEVIYDKLEIALEGLEFKLSQGLNLMLAWGSDSSALQGLWKRALVDASRNKSSWIAHRRMSMKAMPPTSPTRRASTSSKHRRPSVIDTNSQSNTSVRDSEVTDEASIISTSTMPFEANPPSASSLLFGSVDNNNAQIEVAEEDGTLDKAFEEQAQELMATKTDLLDNASRIEELLSSIALLKEERTEIATLRDAESRRVAERHNSEMSSRLEEVSKLRIEVIRLSGLESEQESREHQTQLQAVSEESFRSFSYDLHM